MENKIRTIVVEDELYDRKVIEAILKNHYTDRVELLGLAGTVEEAVSLIKREKPELLLLDIELNGDRNGAFNIIDRVGNSFKIIFVTAKSEQDDLLKAIRISCIDYLVKPTKISDFELPIQRVCDELRNSKSDTSQVLDVFRHNLEVQNLQELKISLQEGFTYRPTYIKNVVRCESEGNYTRFFFTDRSQALINGNLKSFEDRLSNTGFCRVSKHDLVNLSHIRSFSKKI